MTRANCRQGVA